MDSKTQSTTDRIYEDFDPHFDWARDQTRATLLVMLPGFSREQFKIVYTSVLNISGERKTSENKWLRFNKQISIPSDCDTEKMSAKFQNGVLSVMFPLMANPKEEATETLAEQAPRVIMARAATQRIDEKELEKITPQKEVENEATMSQPKGASSSQSDEAKTLKYEDFDPRFTWKRDGTSATLIVGLPGFSKEHLKNIEVTTTLLTISGERKTTENRFIRFSKQFSIPSDCDTKKMSAQFQSGVLNVMFPLLTTSKEAPTSSMARVPTQKQKEPTKPLSERNIEPQRTMKAQEVKTQRVDEKKVGQEVSPYPREEKAEMKSNEVSEKATQKEKEETKAKEKTQTLAEEAPRIIMARAAAQRIGGITPQEEVEKEPAKSQPKGASSQSDETKTQIYEDYEPRFVWKRDETGATLIVGLPGFSKEHLKKIQVTSTLLTISGERKTTENRCIRFNKQFSIPSDCDTENMSAKFQSGVLHVMFPLVTTSKEAPSSSMARVQTQKEKEPTKPLSEGKLEPQGTMKAPEVKTDEVSEQTPLEQIDPKETRRPLEAPKVETQVIDDQQKAAQEAPPKPRAEIAEVNTEEDSEKTPPKEKETTKTPEGQKMMKPQETTKQPEAPLVDQQKAGEDRAEAETKKILKDMAENEKEQYSAKEEGKREADADKVAQRKERTTGLVETTEPKSSEVQEKEGDRMMTRTKTRVLDFTLSLRPTEKDDKESLAGHKEKPKKMMKLIVAILLVVVLVLYAKNAFWSTSSLGRSKF